MNDPSNQSDPAAVFGCALSLWHACQGAARADSRLNLSEAYQGMDQLMREVMSIGSRFENWACANIAFDELDDVWPYLLENRFGAACLRIFLPSDLAAFDDDGCLCVALQLRLPVKATDGLRVPINITARNPTVGSSFAALRVRTVRDHLEDDICEEFKGEDDPFDHHFGEPYFGLYGIGIDGLEEHIASRKTYLEATRLASALAPGIDFPTLPIFEAIGPDSVDKLEFGSAGG